MKHVLWLYAYSISTKSCAECHGMVFSNCFLSVSLPYRQNCWRPDLQRALREQVPSFLGMGLVAHGTMVRDTWNLLKFLGLAKQPKPLGERLKFQGLLNHTFTLKSVTLVWLTRLDWGAGWAAKTGPHDARGNKGCGMWHFAEAGSRSWPASSIHIQVLQWMKRQRNWCDAG